MKRINKLFLCMSAGLLLAGCDKTVDPEPDPTPEPTPESQSYYRLKTFNNILDDGESHLEENHSLSYEGNNFKENISINEDGAEQVFNVFYSLINDSTDSYRIVSKIIDGEDEIIDTVNYKKFNKNGKVLNDVEYLSDGAGPSIDVEGTSLKASTISEFNYDDKGNITEELTREYIDENNLKTIKFEGKSTYFWGISSAEYKTLDVDYQPAVPIVRPQGSLNVTKNSLEFDGDDPIGGHSIQYKNSNYTLFDNLVDFPDVSKDGWEKVAEYDIVFLKTTSPNDADLLEIFTYEPMASKYKMSSAFEIQYSNDKKTINFAKYGSYSGTYFNTKDDVELIPYNNVIENAGTFYKFEFDSNGNQTFYIQGSDFGCTDLNHAEVVNFKYDENNNLTNLEFLYNGTVLSSVEATYEKITGEPEPTSSCFNLFDVLMKHLL